MFRKLRTFCQPEGGLKMTSVVQHEPRKLCYLYSYAEYLLYQPLRRLLSKLLMIMTRSKTDNLTHFTSAQSLDTTT